VAQVVAEPLTLAKIAILAHAVKPFPMPYPPPRRLLGGGYRRKARFAVGGTVFTVEAAYLPRGSAINSVLSREPVVVRASQFADEFRKKVADAVKYASGEDRPVFVVYGQMPLGKGYSFGISVSRRAARGRYIPTPKVIDGCRLENPEADFCYAENLDGNERLMYLVDSGLLLTVLYVFVESRSSALQLELEEGGF
jgi:hypothetical protein